MSILRGEFCESLVPLEVCYIVSNGYWKWSVTLSADGQNIFILVAGKFGVAESRFPGRCTARLHTASSI